MSTHDHTKLPVPVHAINIPFAQHAVADEVQETVDARDLHANLEIGKDYTNWVKAQVKSLHLVENEDFVTFPQKGERKETTHGPIHRP